MLCPKCDAEVDLSAVFCPKCGERLEPASAPPAEGAPPADAGSPRDRFLNAAAEKQGDDDLEEDDLWEGSYARMAMVGSWTLGAVATLAGLVLAIATPLGWGWVLLAVALLWVFLLALYAYRRLSVHYTLTSQRLIHESGLLWRTTDRVELIDIDDVTFVQDPVQRMVGVGTINISSSDTTTPELALPGIQDARRIADVIDDARRRERRRRGLHIESV